VELVHRHRSVGGVFEGNFPEKPAGSLPVQFQQDFGFQAAGGGGPASHGRLVLFAVHASAQRGMQAGASGRQRLDESGVHAGDLDGVRCESHRSPVLIGVDADAFSLQCGDTAPLTVAAS